MREANSKTTTEATTFVVHGVGAPKPHPTDVDAATWDFATTWGRRNGIPLDFSTAIAHPDEGPSIRYGVFEGELSKGGKHRIVELQWADLSHATGGVFGTVLTFFKVVFGLRTIAEATARSLGKEQRSNSFLSKSIFYLLLGPVLGLNLWMVIAILAVSVWPLKYAPELGSLSMIAVLSALPLLFSRLRSIPCVRYLSCFGIVAATVPWWPPFIHLAGIETGFMKHVFTFTSLLNILWLIISLLLVAEVLYWMFARWTLKPETRNSLDVHTFITAAALRAWSLAIPLLGLLVLQTAKRAGGIEAEMQNDVEVMKKVLIPTLGMNWVMLAIISLAFAVTFCWFRRQTASTSTSSSRLIVGAVAKWAVVLTTLAFSGLIVWFWYDLVIRQIDWGGVRPYVIQFQTREWHNHVYGLGWTIAGVLASFVILLHAQIRTALDFVVDVINYFAVDHGDSALSRQVIARFEAVVENETAGRDGEILFMAHSLGSVLVTDYLRRGGRADARLVTMGSPISHLFAYYFPNWFWPNGGPSKPDHVREWLNLYRNSDYVGQEVVYASENLSIGKGFHTGYFEDHRVHKELEARGWIPSNT